MDNDTRRRLCRLIAGIVVVDNDLDDAESRFVDHMLARFGLSPDERDALFPIIDAGEAAEELKTLAPPLQHEAFALLVEAATLDRRYADEEKDYLYKVGAVINLSPADIDARVQAALGAATA